MGSGRPYRLKIRSYHARANANEAARWGYWARYFGFQTVGAWLEALANREVRRIEIEHGYRRPEPHSNTDARM